MKCDCKLCRAARRRERYHRDPVARAKQIAAARNWLINNRERHNATCRRRAAVKRAATVNQIEITDQTGRPLFLKHGLMGARVTYADGRQILKIYCDLGDDDNGQL